MTLNFTQNIPKVTLIEMMNGYFSRKMNILVENGYGIRLTPFLLTIFVKTPPSHPRTESQIPPGKLGETRGNSGKLGETRGNSGKLEEIRGNSRKFGETQGNFRKF